MPQLEIYSLHQGLFKFQGHRSGHLHIRIYIRLKTFFEDKRKY